MARRKKPRQSKTVTDAEHFELLADITRMINAWEKHAPNKTFGGMTLEEFKKEVQPSFDADAELARLEWEMARLKRLLGEEDSEAPSQH